MNKKKWIQKFLNHDSSRYLKDPHHKKFYSNKYHRHSMPPAYIWYDYIDNLILDNWKRITDEIKSSGDQYRNFTRVVHSVENSIVFGKAYTRNDQKLYEVMNDALIETAELVDSDDKYDGKLFKRFIRILYLEKPNMSFGDIALRVGITLKTAQEYRFMYVRAVAYGLGYVNKYRVKNPNMKIAKKNRKHPYQLSRSQNRSYRFYLETRQRKKLK